MPTPQIVVSCPNCLSKFRVTPTEDAGPGFIKCSSCAHVFVVNPELMKSADGQEAGKTSEFLPELSFIDPPDGASLEDDGFTAPQTVPLSGDQDLRNRGRKATLVIGAGQALEIEKFKTTFGRRNADVVLDDPDVSRQHAVIERYDEKYLLKDLESTNGTFLNGQRVTVDFLKDGDVIRLGKTVVRFQLR